MFIEALLAGALYVQQACYTPSVPVPYGGSTQTNGTVTSTFDVNGQLVQNYYTPNTPVCTYTTYNQNYTVNYHNPYNLSYYNNYYRYRYNQYYYNAYNYNQYHYYQPHNYYNYSR